MHHYTQVRGFEEAHFANSKEIIMNLITQYRDLQSEKEADISRLQII